MHTLIMSVLKFASRFREFNYLVVRGSLTTTCLLWPFPYSSIMFVEFGELCSQPQETVASVLRFVGADPARLKFKALALTSGEGKGRRMHPAVRRKLHHYFAVPNQRLFSLIGREFAWGMADAEDEEEGGGGPARIPVLHTDKVEAKVGKTGKSTAVDLLPKSAVGRKDSDSRMVKRVVSISARV